MDVDLLYEYESIKVKVVVFYIFTHKLQSHKNKQKTYAFKRSNKKNHLSMTRFTLFMGCLFALMACNTQKATVVQVPVPNTTSTTAAKIPILTLDKPIVDFGKLVVGEKHAHTYHFKNTGNADLIIEMVSGCDCTQILEDYPRMIPIKPGQGGKINIIYDSGKSKDKLGEQMIDVNIIANTEPIVVEAKFKVDVVKAKE
jgi:hypothetical protein